MISQQEAFWDKQRESLNRLRNQIIDQRTQRRLSNAAGSNVGGRSKPPSAEIRRRRSAPDTSESSGLVRVVDQAKHHLVEAKSTTPPPRNLPRMTSPEDRAYQTIHHNKVRGSKYNVVPPVRPKRAFQKEKRRKKPSSDDSWGESESDSEDEYPAAYPYPQYAHPYPYAVFPPIYAPPPIYYQTRPRPRHKKRKRREADRAPATYVLRPSHDQGTSTVDDKGTQWQEMIRTMEAGIDPMPSPGRSPVGRGGRGRGRTPRDIPVEIYVTPASRASGQEAPPEPEQVDGDYDDESTHSEKDTQPEVPPRAHLPKYYYYYNSQRPRYNRDLFDERTNSVLRRYKYYYDSNAAQTIQEEPEDMSLWPYDLQVLKTFLDDESFADSLMERLIDDFLCEDLIPDVMIDALSIDTLPSYHPMFGPSKQVANDILQTELVRIGRDVAREVVHELVDEYMYEQHKLLKDPLDEFLDNLYMETILELLLEAVQEGVNELAHEYIVEKAIRAVIMMMVNEIIAEDGENLLNESIYEVMVEDILSETVYDVVINKESRDIAEEVINEYDTKIRRRAVKEIDRLGREKLLESSILDVLLTKIAHDGRIWTEAEYMDKMLHGMMLDIILRERDLIDTRRDATIENKAIKKLHEKMFTDVAVDVVLDELTQWLDEDLAELDERERGINVQDDCLPTDVNTWLYSEVAPLEPPQTPTNGDGHAPKRPDDKPDPPANKKQAKDKKKKPPDGKDQGVDKEKTAPDKRFSRFARVAGALV